MLPRKEEIRAGDLILGLPSSGIHSNGLSLARKVIPESDMAAWEEMLIPTRIYAREMDGAGAARARCSPRRTSPAAGCTATSSASSRTRSRRGSPSTGRSRRSSPRIQSAGGVSDEEMRAVFNLGIGIALIAHPADARMRSRRAARGGLRAPGHRGRCALMARLAVFASGTGSNFVAIAGGPEGGAPALPSSSCSATWRAPRCSSGRRSSGSRSSVSATRARTPRGGGKEDRPPPGEARRGPRGAGRLHEAPHPVLHRRLQGPDHQPPPQPAAEVPRRACHRGELPLRTTPSWASASSGSTRAWTPGRSCCRSRSRAAGRRACQQIEERIHALEHEWFPKVIIGMLDEIDGLAGNVRAAEARDESARPRLRGAGARAGLEACREPRACRAVFAGPGERGHRGGGNEPPGRESPGLRHRSRMPAGHTGSTACSSVPRRRSPRGSWISWPRSGIPAIGPRAGRRGWSPARRSPRRSSSETACPRRRGGVLGRGAASSAACAAQRGARLVVKKSGLAAGKGVLESSERRRAGRLRRVDSAEDTAPRGRVPRGLGGLDLRPERREGLRRASAVHGLQEGARRRHGSEHGRHGLDLPGAVGGRGAHATHPRRKSWSPTYAALAREGLALRRGPVLRAHDHRAGAEDARVQRALRRPRDPGAHAHARARSGRARRGDGAGIARPVRPGSLPRRPADAGRARPSAWWSRAAAIRRARRRAPLVTASPRRPPRSARSCSTPPPSRDASGGSPHGRRKVLHRGRPGRDLARRVGERVRGCRGGALRRRLVSARHRKEVHRERMKDVLFLIGSESDTPAVEPGLQLLSEKGMSFDLKVHLRAPQPRAARRVPEAGRSRLPGRDRRGRPLRGASRGGGLPREASRDRDPARGRMRSPESTRCFPSSSSRAACPWPRWESASRAC